MNKPINTAGFVIVKSSMLESIVFTLSVYDTIRASAVKAAEPIAKPFPVAAVVFPSESSASVRLRTSLSRPDISAIPPALSATGPYASVARVIPSVESIPTAERPIP